MTAIHTTTDWTTYTPLTQLDDDLTPELDTHTTGNRTYQAGHLDAPTELVTAIFETTDPERFLVLDDGTYIRITSAYLTSDTTGRLDLDQSRLVIVPANNRWDDPEAPTVEVRIIEPSPPTAPQDWFFTEVTRALTDHHAQQQEGGQS